MRPFSFAASAVSRAASSRARSRRARALAHWAVGTPSSAARTSGAPSALNQRSSSRDKRYTAGREISVAVLRAISSSRRDGVVMGLGILLFVFTPIETEKLPPVAQLFSFWWYFASSPFSGEGKKGDGRRGFGQTADRER